MTENRPTRFYSNMQEKYIAKMFDMKQQSNSGATPFSKGDVVGKNILIECKTTIEEKKSFSIKKNVLEDIQKEARGESCDYSAVAFNFGGGPNKNYFVIDETLFGILIENLKGE